MGDTCMCHTIVHCLSYLTVNTSTALNWVPVPHPGEVVVHQARVARVPVIVAGSRPALVSVPEAAFEVTGFSPYHIVALPAPHDRGVAPGDGDVAEPAEWVDAYMMSCRRWGALKAQIDFVKEFTRGRGAEIRNV